MSININNSILLLAPEKFFIDKQHQPNSYNDTNPSLYISTDGTITVLVRQVNYRKFSNQAFTLGQDKSISKYVIMRGNSFNNLKTKDIQYDWNQFPKYNTYWEGMEDIRFVNDKLLLVTVPERNSNGNPCLFLAELIIDELPKIKLLQQLNPHITEKNWMPYCFNNTHQVIYSVSPFIIKSFVEDDKIHIDFDKQLQNQLIGYHGSTNGVTYMNDDILFLIHKYESKSYHRWLTYNPNTLIVKVSNPFSFYMNSYIEFPCSLVSYDNKFYVSLGINDSKAIIVTILPNEINLL
jgi:hypothetical protein